MILPVVTKRQHAAILAGLRLYQALQDGNLTAQRMSDVGDIATNLGQYEALSAEQVEILIQRMNAS